MTDYLNILVRQQKVDITDRVISYGMSAFIFSRENKPFNLRHYLPIVFVMQDYEGSVKYH